MDFSLLRVSTLKFVRNSKVWSTSGRIERKWRSSARPWEMVSDQQPHNHKAKPAVTVFFFFFLTWKEEKEELGDKLRLEGDEQNELRNKKNVIWNRKRSCRYPYISGHCKTLFLTNWTTYKFESSYQNITIFSFQWLGRFELILVIRTCNSFFEFFLTSTHHFKR